MLFIKALENIDFQCFSVAIDKSRLDVKDPILASKIDLYRHAYCLALAELSCQEKLVIVMDHSGDRDFRHQLRVHLSHLTAPGQIKKFRQQNSRRVPSLQVADYVSSLCSRQLQGSKDWRTYAPLLTQHQHRLVKYP